MAQLVCQAFERWGARRWPASKRAAAAAGLVGRAPACGPASAKLATQIPLLARGGRPAGPAPRQNADARPAAAVASQQARPTEAWEAVCAREAGRPSGSSTSSRRALAKRKARVSPAAKAVLKGSAQGPCCPGVNGPTSASRIPASHGDGGQAAHLPLIRNLAEWLPGWLQAARLL